MKKINFKKSEISKDFSQDIGYSSNYSIKLVNDLLDCMIENICNSDLKLKNFGSFKIINKSKRIGRNPKTKEPKTVSQRNVVLFKPSNQFKNFINFEQNDQS